VAQEEVAGLVILVSVDKYTSHRIRMNSLLVCDAVVCTAEVQLRVVTAEITSLKPAMGGG
jgi:hypothetical protein